MGKYEGVLFCFLNIKSVNYFSLTLILADF